MANHNESVTLDTSTQPKIYFFKVVSISMSILFHMFHFQLRFDQNLQCYIYSVTDTIQCFILDFCVLLNCHSYTGVKVQISDGLEAMDQTTDLLKTTAKGQTCKCPVKILPFGF